MDTIKEKNKKRVEGAKRGWKKRRQIQVAKATPAEPKTTSPESGQPFIKTPYPDGDLAQIYSTGLEYAFVNAEGTQCHPFVLCKDFLQDSIWALLNGTVSSIWGFSYNAASNPPLDLNKTRLAVRYTKNKDFKQLSENALIFLNTLEGEFGMEKSQLYYGGKSKDEDVFVFEGDKKWMYAPPMISLYTLLIRVGLNYEGGDWKKQLEKTNLLGKNDRNYLNNSRTTILSLCGQNIMEIFAKEMSENYPKECSIGSMHDYSGIESLGLKKIASGVSKNWQKKSI